MKNVLSILFSAKKNYCRKAVLLFMVLFCSFCIGYGQIITTVAGTGISGYTGDGGPATSARIAVDKIICDRFGNIYFGQRFSNKVRKIDISTGVITCIAGNGTGGFSGDGGQATAAEINNPVGTALDTSGNLYIADLNNNRIRKVDAATGIISTYAGNDSGGITGFSGDGGMATAAALGSPYLICIDRNNNLYVSTLTRVRKVSSSGIISTVAGNGSYGYGGDGGPATAAQFRDIQGLGVNLAGSYLYVCDWENYRLRKVDLGTGVVTTIAGTDSGAYNGDSIAATTANVYPLDVFVDNIGVLYIADDGNNRIRKVDTSGIIYTIVGNGVRGYSGDNGLADTSEISGPEGVFMDNMCNLYVGDFGNNRLRKVYLGTSTTDTPTLSVSLSSSDTICSGTPVTFSSTYSGGGSIVTYQWYKDTTAISGATSATYTYTPANGDSVKCILTTWNRCSSPSYGWSNVVHMVVNTAVSPSITISASPGDTVCAGTTVTYAASVTGGGASPSFHWLVNGSGVSTAGSSYSYTPDNGDSVRCVVVGSALCSSTTGTSSNIINMGVNPTVTPTINITASPGDTVCPGTLVTFTATISGGGSAPGFRWWVNSMPISSGSSWSYIPSDGDSVSCVLTSNALCASPASVTSDTLRMTILPGVTPTIHITASPGDSICNADAVSYTATYTGGGTSPSFAWLVDGTIRSTSGSGYSYSAINGDSVRCVLVSDASCASPDTVSSNEINMVVASLGIPVITLSGPSVAPIGSSVTITATVTGAGSSYIIHWLNEGVEFTTTTVPSVTYTKTMATDSISARIVSNDFCYDSTLSAGHLVWDHNVGTPILSGSGDELQCYPNPAHSVVYIENQNDYIKFRLVNVVGVILNSGDLNVGTNNISISDLPAGIYFFEALNSNGAVKRIKFLKE